MLGGRAHAVPGDRRLGAGRHGGARRRVRRTGPPGVDRAAQRPGSGRARLRRPPARRALDLGAQEGAEVESSAEAEQAALLDALDRLRLDRVRHAEALLADPREHPDLWELDGALVTLVDRMLLELDTASHVGLWEEHHRDVVDRHRASELFERLRTRRADGRTAGEPAAGQEPAPPDGETGRREEAP